MTKHSGETEINADYDLRDVKEWLADTHAPPHVRKSFDRILTQKKAIVKESSRAVLAIREIRRILKESRVV